MSYLSLCRENDNTDTFEQASVTEKKTSSVVIDFDFHEKRVVDSNRTECLSMYRHTHILHTFQGSRLLRVFVSSTNYPDVR